MRRYLVVIALVGCEPAPRAAEPVQPRTKPTVAPVSREWATRISKAVETYGLWGRVDDDVRPAPIPCAAPGPPPEEPHHPRVSEAADAPHGQKLYYLYASDRDAYLANTPKDVGFTIVKESFQAIAADADARDVVVVGDKRLTPGDPTGLFVMMKVAESEDTDGGWIYGTLSPDHQVTSAGRVASCIECHAAAPHERLFGLKK